MNPVSERRIKAAEDLYETTIKPWIDAILAENEYFFYWVILLIFLLILLRKLRARRRRKDSSEVKESGYKPKGGYQNFKGDVWYPDGRVWHKDSKRWEDPDYSNQKTKE